MPPALGFHAGSSCGPGEACWTLFSRSQCVGLVHVADDEGHVLKPAVVAARVYRRGPALGRQELGEFQEFVAQLQARDAQAQPEDAFQVFLGVAAGFGLRDLPEVQDARCRSPPSGPGRTR